MIKVTTALGWVLRLYGLTQHPVNGVFMVWTDRSGEPQALNYLSSIPDNREMSVKSRQINENRGSL